MTTPTRIVLLPGLAADQRMFAAHRARWPGLEVPPWIEPHGREDLGAYARRLAATIAPDPPFILGGASFGGMVAWEMARYCRPLALVLIGAAIHPREISAPLRMVTRLAHRMPLSAIRLLTPWGAWLAWPAGAATYRDRRAIERVVRDARPSFARWCADAIARWQPSPPPEMPWLRIHGRADPVIRPDPRSGAIAWVAGAAHYLDGQHARRVERIIAHLHSGSAGSA
ncbi:MAG: alpha/beta fold hydrolase [Planctomycetes bacterium]|nr:alpha/beta fold hydrolase [Planctomycetota bacterium]